jgi:hypothetical protein
LGDFAMTGLYKYRAGYFCPYKINKKIKINTWIDVLDPYFKVQNKTIHLKTSDFVMLMTQKVPK